jgi:hypothetical protein
MTDSVTSQTLLDGERLAIMKFTNISDGTGESAVIKVDVSALNPSASGGACTSVSVLKITAVCHGMEVRMLWAASTDVPFFLSNVNSNYTNDFSSFGGITNNSGAGKNGDIKFTTSDHSSGDTYTVVLEMIKGYASV